MEGVGVGRIVYGRIIYVRYRSRKNSVWKVWE